MNDLVIAMGSGPWLWGIADLQPQIAIGKYHDGADRDIWTHASPDNKFYDLSA
jgi:hypothetical protein